MFVAEFRDHLRGQNRLFVRLYLKQYTVILTEKKKWESSCSNISLKVRRIYRTARH